jgi:hypothetical protein
MANSSKVKGASKYVTRGHTLVKRDKRAHGYRLSPIKCEIFDIKEGVDIIIGMNWLKQFGENFSFRALQEGKPVDEIFIFFDLLPLEDEVVKIRTHVQFDQLMAESIYVRMITVSFEKQGSYKATVAAVDKRDLMIDKVERIT